MEHYFTLVHLLLLYVCGVVSVFSKFTTIFVRNNSLEGTILFTANRKISV